MPLVCRQICTILLIHERKYPKLKLFQETCHCFVEQAVSYTSCWYIALQVAACMSIAQGLHWQISTEPLSADDKSLNDLSMMKDTLPVTESRSYSTAFGTTNRTETVVRLFTIHCAKNVVDLVLNQWFSKILNNCSIIYAIQFRKWVSTRLDVTFPNGSQIM